MSFVHDEADRSAGLRMPAAVLRQDRRAAPAFDAAARRRERAPGMRRATPSCGRFMAEEAPMAGAPRELFR